MVNSNDGEWRMDPHSPSRRQTSQIKPNQGESSPIKAMFFYFQECHSSTFSKTSACALIRRDERSDTAATLARCCPSAVALRRVDGRGRPRTCGSIKSAKQSYGRSANCRSPILPVRSSRGRCRSPQWLWWTDPCITFHRHPSKSRQVK